MTILRKLRELLKGKKTYILGLVWVILGILNEVNVDQIMQGLLILTGRAAIAK